MDPQACLDAAERALEDCRLDDCLLRLADYRIWRQSGGFEPKGGDALAEKIAQLRMIAVRARIVSSLSLPSSPNIIAERIERMAREAIAMDALGPWSHGEMVAVCLVLDRYDWLQEQGYTMLAGVERLGPEWLAAAMVARKAINR
jgi:hypothetical protein